MSPLTHDLADLQNTVAAWEGISVAPHRFGGVEFQMGNVEIGHVHRNGMVDIPFTRKIRAVLLADGYAQPHHLLPETGWISYYMGRGGDLAGAIQLLRLSYLQKRRRRVAVDVSAEWATLTFNDTVKAVALGTLDDEA